MDSSQMFELILENQFSIITFIVLYMLTYYHINKPAKIIRDSRRWKLNNSTQNLMDESVPPFLNGWSVLLESSELSRNQIKPVMAFGKDLVVYRGASNVCYAFDAYCPHLGANLGVGGTVVGDSVQCPFHGWVFDQNGHCAHVPGVDGAINAKLKKYQVLEVNGFICVWYHPNEKEPDWFISEHEEIKENKMSFRGSSLNIMNCFTEEIFQHLGDKEHNSFVHAEHKYWAFRPKDGLIYKLIHKSVRLEYPEINWAPGHDSFKHTSIYDVAIKVTLLGCITMNFHNYVETMGPCLLKIRTEFNYFGKRKLFSVFGLTQVKKKLCMGTLRVYSESGIINNLLAKHFLDTTCAVWDKDGMILANKKYLFKPLLAENEIHLKGYQNWIGQFYK